MHQISRADVQFLWPQHLFFILNIDKSFTLDKVTFRLNDWKINLPPLTLNVKYWSLVRDYIPEKGAESTGQSKPVGIFVFMPPYALRGTLTPSIACRGCLKETNCYYLTPLGNLLRHCLMLKAPNLHYLISSESQHAANAQQSPGVHMHDSSFHTFDNTGCLSVCLSVSMKPFFSSHYAWSLPTSKRCHGEGSH